MQHPDEGTIHAWLDGALSAEESATLDAHVASCSECSAAVAEARGLIAASSRIVSALDIVPGGVIPARKPIPRPWYANTQLRAAAAVLFVAGASVILLRNQGGESLSTVSERVMADEAAPMAAQAESDAASVEQAAREPAPAPQPPANAAATRKAVQQKAENTGTTGTAEAPQAAVSIAERSEARTMAAPAPPPVAAVQDTVAFSKATVAAAPVVVTGIASSDLASDLRVLSVDSSTSTRVTRYRIASGAELTLTEATAEEFTGKGALRQEPRRDAAPPAAPAPAPRMRQAAAASEAPVQSISWIDAATGTRYTLSGRVPVEVLEEVKERIQKMH